MCASATEQVMESVGLAERAGIDQAGVLTYAEQRALEIGITIAAGAKVILLDEPMAGMSRSETEHAVAADPACNGRQDAAHGRA